MRADDSMPVEILPPAQAQLGRVVAQWAERARPYSGWLVWAVAAALLLLLPLVFTQSYARSLLTQSAIAIVFALSYNMLLGQSGMLSFGHAVYSGLGGYVAIHALNWIAAERLTFPVSLLPLIGGISGLAFGAVFGYLTTRRAGTTFAMISLGIGEMVHAAALMFPDFFGGEGGVSGNRTSGGAFLGVEGWTLGSDLHVYYLIAAWSLLSTLAMYALTRTPLGRIANAVRDNPERAEFIGYSTQRVRWLMLMLASFFAGIAGGLAAITFEIVTPESVGPVQSGAVLLAAFIGGTGVFWGPIVGAVVWVLFSVVLSAYTLAWQLYLGAFFIVLVMYAPGGIAGVWLSNWRVLRHRGLPRLGDAYFGALAAGAALLSGAVLVIEMTYQLTLGATFGGAVRWFGFALAPSRAESWALALTLLVAGAASFDYMRRRLQDSWSEAGAQVEARRESVLG
jgi:branched-chain amino acid transport system permease protein